MGFPGDGVNTGALGRGGAAGRARGAETGRVTRGLGGAAGRGAGGAGAGSGGGVTGAAGAGAGASTIAGATGVGGASGIAAGGAASGTGGVTGPGSAPTRSCGPVSRLGVGATGVAGAASTPTGMTLEHTVQRARRPPAGTLAGSTRYTVSHEGQRTFIVRLPCPTDSRRAGDRPRRPILGGSSRSSSSRSRVRSPPQGG